MKARVRQYLRTHPMAVSIATFLLVSVLASVFLLRSLQRFVVPVVTVGMAAYYAWSQTQMPARKVGASAYTLTIRDQFQRSRTLLVRTILPLLALWVVFVLQFWPTPLTSAEREGVAIAGGVVIAIIASALVKHRMRCPRCSSNFRRERIARLGRFTLDTRGTEELWTSCPQCGVSFDEPWAM